MNRMPITHSELSRFVLVGGVGFCVDGGVLLLLHQHLGLGILLARLVSFSLAGTTTWYLNRRLTFNAPLPRRPRDEWTRYLAVNGLGALLNLSVFILIIQLFPSLAPYPLLVLAIAALTALIFNFLGSKYFVFHKEQAGR